MRSHKSGASTTPKPVNPLSETVIKRLTTSTEHVLSLLKKDATALPPAKLKQLTNAIYSGLVDSVRVLEDSCEGKPVCAETGVFASGQVDEPFEVMLATIL
jgi:hypothetical protein